MANGIESTIPLQAVDIRSTSSDSLPPSFDENTAEDNVAKNSINSWNTQQFQINEIISRPKKCAVCHKTARWVLNYFYGRKSASYSLSKHFREGLWKIKYTV